MVRLAREGHIDAALDIVDKNREKIKKLQTFDLRYFNGRRYFCNDGSQNYLTFQSISKTSRMATGDTEAIIA